MLHVASNQDPPYPLTQILIENLMGPERSVVHLVLVLSFSKVIISYSVPSFFFDLLFPVSCFKVMGNESLLSLFFFFKQLDNVMNLS
jgi:hypothetical protein